MFHHRFLQQLGIWILIVMMTTIPTTIHLQVSISFATLHYYRFIQCFLINQQAICTAIPIHVSHFTLCSFKLYFLKQFYIHSNVQFCHASYIHYAYVGSESEDDTTSKYDYDVDHVSIPHPSKHKTQGIVHHQNH